MVVKGKRELVKEASAVRWLTVAQAAALLAEQFNQQVPVRTILSWCHRPRDPVPHVRLGSRILIHADALLEWTRRDTGTQGGAA